MRLWSRHRTNLKDDLTRVTKKASWPSWIGFSTFNCDPIELTEGPKIIEKEDDQTTGLSFGIPESIHSSNFGSNNLTLGTRKRTRTSTPYGTGF